ncbi:MAG: hypothetical protein LAO07_14570 [Acidobacteriia bacterium]|nr:hypothetical protein [Terriglobia bacterium]
MQAKNYTRRDFLKLVGLGLGSMAFRPFFAPGEDLDSGDIIRIATYSISVYKEPNDKSKILYQRKRDDLVNVYDEIISPDGPGYNPIWFKVWGGYIHSARIEKVKIRLNPVVENIPERGQLAEVTVPFTQTLRYDPYKKKWNPVYRLYYESTQWVVGVDEGPDGTPNYNWAVVVNSFGTNGVVQLAYNHACTGFSTPQYFELGAVSFDEWHSLEVEVLANSPGQSDGRITIWFDGNQVAQDSAVNLRGTFTTGIARIEIGNQADRLNYLAVEEYRYWDDIVISTSRIGP